jgi:hypothetical protein
MITLGIDVSQAQLDPALCQEGSTVVLEPVPNTLGGWEQLEAMLAARLATPQLKGLDVVVEPTGGYELPFAVWAYQRGWRVHRPNAARVREWVREPRAPGQDRPARRLGVGPLRGRAASPMLAAIAW